MKRRHTFADIEAKRERYNPAVEGYGNPRQWRGEFQERMGFKEAQRIMDESPQDTPRGILGVGLRATWNEIVSAYRRKAMACHPDRAALNRMTIEHATELFKKVSAAYAVLAHQFGK